MFAAFVLISLVVLSVEGTPVPTAEALQESSANPNEICHLPMARGHCRALLPRWRYDPETKTCQEFKFGGCAGNGNNFISYEQCMQMCGGV